MPEYLFGKTLEELKTVGQSLGLPSFTGNQLAEWLYKKEVSSFGEMTNLSKKARTMLQEDFLIGMTPPIDVRNRWTVPGNTCSLRWRVNTLKQLIFLKKNATRSVFPPRWVVRWVASSV